MNRQQKPKRRQRYGRHSHQRTPMFIGPLPENEIHLYPKPLYSTPHQQQQQATEPNGKLTLERRCVRQFPRIALARGRQYFSHSRATDPTWNEQECTVIIKGTGGDYKVTFDFSQVAEARKLPGTCNCPAYERGILCKHLWTAILQIDKAGPAENIPESGPLKIVHASPAQRQPGNNPKTSANGNGHERPRHALPNWQDRLNVLQGLNSVPASRIISTTTAAFFVISALETASTGKLVLDLWTRNRSLNGEFGPLRPNRVSNHDFTHFADVRDQEILSLLTRTGNPQIFAPYGRSSGNISSRFTVDPIFEPHVVSHLASAGKLFLSRAPNGTPVSAEHPLRLDRGKTWDFELRIEPAGDFYKLDGVFKHGSEQRSLSSPLAILSSGFLLFDDRIGRFTEPSHAPWAIALRGKNEFLVPKADGDTLLTRLLLDASSPKVSWPSTMGWIFSPIEPRPKGVFRPLGNDPTIGRMVLNVSFDYEGIDVPLSESKTMFVDAVAKRVYPRNTEFEEKTLLKALEIMHDPQGTGSVPYSDLHRAATELCREGWTIHFENQKLRIADDFSLNVSSSTDWFDLKLDASFGNVGVETAELLAALESNSGLVKLADGSLGMLPPEWLAKYAPIAALGTQSAEKTEDGTYRFTRSQGLMLNAVLPEDGNLTSDDAFRSFRDRIQKFKGVELANIPKDFKGQLRDYQKEGLTWLQFLEEFETGGILADDMGLGKTVQILAFILARSRSNGKKGKTPSLVVVPKSLAFNWVDEAEKFAPTLKVVRYTGSGRSQLLKEIEDADLVVTTYGAVRTDIEKLAAIEFDVVIVDEAQAIKNPKSLSAQAVKRLRARHRLALTGTPIENSINDLLSILEFTNPGILNHSQQKEMNQDKQAVLAKTLKPFLLRRTKEKVLTELPDKSEQVLFCEMSASERLIYTAIRDRYRASLEKKIEEGGLAKSKLHVLEALLRLRQAACHAGLIDPNRRSEPSAKLQLLLSQVQEVIAEGHKVLIFSQFTSLLALVKTDLEAKGITYEYLDGQTTDRKTPVERFQTDPSCPVFLISLKAGGTGLNLTAADYVFILDPWWNPAVEAQAIGRAHRMGQTNKVIAYRMIAKGTVEEKILELQKTKKDLAESIISEDKDFFKKLTKEDLEHLLA